LGATRDWRLSLDIDVSTKIAEEDYGWHEMLEIEEPFPGQTALMLTGQ
jgi:hypothetical protein